MLSSGRPCARDPRQSTDRSGPPPSAGDERPLDRVRADQGGTSSDILRVARRPAWSTRRAELIAAAPALARSHAAWDTVVHCQASALFSSRPRWPARVDCGGGGLEAKGEGQARIE